VAAGGAGGDAPYRQIADAFLFRGASAAGHEQSDAGTSSFAARSAFLRGHLALQQWNLAAADSSLAQAIVLDPNYAAAHLWLAQVRDWASDNPQEWRSLAGNAVARRAQLPEREQKLAAALLHMANAQYPQACALYDGLRRRDPHDFVATYGLGECLRRDDVVIRDARTASGWRFRASRFQAMNAYRDAFELLPSIHKAFSARAFERMRGILMTAAAMRIGGRPLPPDTTTFWAAPSWAGDTLVLVPYPKHLELSAPVGLVSSTTVSAVNHQRELFRDIAASWRRAFPDDVAPREAMAVALELLGDSTALDTLRVARQLATEEEQRFGLAWQEVWLRVKFGLPDNLVGLEAARSLADSLLQSAPTAPLSRAERLASLGILTGKAHLAASLARRVDEHSQYDATKVPMRTYASARALLVYASIGAPLDSLHTMEARIANEVRSTVAPAQQAAVLSSLLGQSAGLSFPVYRFANLATFTGRGNPLLDAQYAYARGDSLRARRILEERKRVRATLRPADLTLDITYPAAWTLFALGDRAAAVEWLDPVLNAAQLYPPEIISRLGNAGALMRGTMFRAELARQAADAATARRWARPVAILWADADPFLRPLVQSMHTMAFTRQGAAALTN
jgi:tetratricopeptide (TPR) repeat protein